MNVTKMPQMHHNNLANASSLVTCVCCCQSMAELRGMSRARKKGVGRPGHACVSEVGHYSESGRQVRWADCQCGEGWTDQADALEEGCAR